MVNVIMRLKARPSKDIELKQTLQGLKEPTRKTKGCLSHAVFKDVEDKSSFCLIERWETRADLDNHRQSDSFAVLMGTRSLLEREPEIIVNEISHSSI